MNKKRVTFKAFVEAYAKDPESNNSCPEWDFCNDAIRDKQFKNHTNWHTLKRYLEGRRGVCEEAVLAAKVVFEDWAKKHGPIDGMSPKDIEKLRKATRQVWSWSVPRKLCLERAKDEDGFYHCEHCKMKAPKIHVDHKIAVGDLDAGYFDRLFTPSKNLQALCADCHGAKTRADRKVMEAQKDFF